MADQQPVPQRRFKTRAGIQRKTAEERAAFVQAEAHRQEQGQGQRPAPPSSSQAPQRGRKAGSFGQNEAIGKNQNTESVFGSTGTATSSKTKDKKFIGGTEQLIERGEVESAPAAETAKGSRKSDAKPTSKRTNTRAPKNAAKADEVLFLPEDDDQADAVDIDDIERSLGLSDEEMVDEDDDVILTHTRRVNRTSKPNTGLRPVRAARDPPLDQDVQEHKPVRARRPGKEKDKAQSSHASDDILDPGTNDVAISTRPLTPPPQDEAAPKSSPTKRRRKSSTRDSRPQFDTLEERGEKDRYAAELRMMQREFSLPTTSDHKSESKGKASFPLNPEQQRLYLFQFPPLTPMLTSQPASTSEIKAEKQPSSITISDSPTRPSGSLPFAKEKEKDAPAQPTQPISSDPNTDKRNIVTALNDPCLPAGLAGRLNIHRSGRATIEWGCAESDGTDTTNFPNPLAPGTATTATAASNPAPTTTLPASTVTNLELKWGTDVEFLQDVVQLSDPHGDSDNGIDGDGDIDMEGGRAGNSDNADMRKAWALSQVRNKFVVVPDWGRIFE